MLKRHMLPCPLPLPCGNFRLEAGVRWHFDSDFSEERLPEDATCVIACILLPLEVQDLVFIAAEQLRQHVSGCEKASRNSNFTCS